ncbi:hypothetical protein GQ44DRAFT_829086 [Phaeosphaeriaceae sp. PMI808]|nr:hypothetical protein GQ44DRAFT_829086 [Phaeosphaeriaceae sp. PMI808]
MFIFLAGTAACVMSVLGLIYRQRGFRYFLLTTIEYTVGVIIPCMAPFAKFSKQLYTSVQSTIYGSSFQRTSSVDGHHNIDNMQKKEVSHTNTIDRMLAQMFPEQTETRKSKNSEESKV